MESIEISKQYDLLKELNRSHALEIIRMKKEYKEATRIYEDLQSKAIQEEIDELVLITKQIFPQYDVIPTKFGMMLLCINGIHKNENQGEYYAKNDTSGLGTYWDGEEIYKRLIDKLGPIIKTGDSEVAWFDPKNNKDYDEKTSWVYRSIEYNFKKTYLNSKFNFKSTPLSAI